MSRKEAPRIGLLTALVARRVTGREVAAALAVTVRQVWHLKRRFEAGGAKGLPHRSQGRPSPRRLAAQLRQRVATLLTTTCRDFNDCHGTEKRQEVERQHSAGSTMTIRVSRTSRTLSRAPPPAFSP